MPSATGISRALRSFSPRHQRAAPFDDGEENSLRTAHFCAPCAQKYTLARHQPSGLPRPVPLGRGSRREYFATYTPPRNMNFDFIRGLRAANFVRRINSGRTPVIRIVLRLPISEITFSYGGGRFFSHRPKTAGGDCHFFVSLKDVQAFFTFQVEICTRLLYNISCIRASGYRSPDIFHTSFSRAPQFLKEEK